MGANIWLKGQWQSMKHKKTGVEMKKIAENCIAESGHASQNEMSHLQPETEVITMPLAGRSNETLSQGETQVCRPESSRDGLKIRAKDKDDIRFSHRYRLRLPFRVRLT